MKFSKKFDLLKVTPKILATKIRTETIDIPRLKEIRKEKKRKNCWIEESLK
mgnify:CR=1 FL=1